MCIPNLFSARIPVEDSLNHILKGQINDSLRMEVMLELLSFYMDRERHSAGDSICNEMQLIAEKYDYKEYTGLNALARGIYYNRVYDFERSQKYLSYALLDLDPVKQKHHYSDAASYMGFIQEKMGDYKKASAYHKTALSIRIKLDPRSTINSYMRLAGCFSQLKILDSAYYYFYKGIALAEKINSGRAGLYNNLGITYDLNGQIDSAFKYYYKALEIYRSKNSLSYIAGSLINIGSLHHTRKEYDKAIKLYKEGLEICMHIKNIPFMANAYHGLSDSYEAKGDYKNAYLNFKYSKNYQDSLMNERKISEMANAEEKYQSEKKQKELEIAQLKIDSQNERLASGSRTRKLLAGGLIVALIAGGWILWGYVQKRRLSTELTKKNFEVNAQKNIIEEKQKEIMNSLHYARRIQKAQLPSERYILRSINKKN